jgi:hypothetical protein
MFVSAPVSASTHSSRITLFFLTVNAVIINLSCSVTATVKEYYFFQIQNKQQDDGKYCAFFLELQSAGAGYE